MTNPDICDTPAHRQSFHHDMDDPCSQADPKSGATSHQDKVLPDAAKLPFVPPVVFATHLQDPDTTVRAARQGRPTESAHTRAALTGDERSTPLHSRREVIRRGSNLAFTAPIISTFYASQAYAGNYSCYGDGHPCITPTEDNLEPCCPGLNCTGPNPKTCK